MPTREQRHIQIHADADIDDAPVLLENCYHTVVGNVKRGAPLPSKL